ncbi:hypothetical protein [Gilliamella intestini]|nr:hypothetical protein [Gilliamella intestini]
MLKKTTPATPEKIEQISLDALVPQNHLVRKIAKVIVEWQHIFKQKN